MEDTLSDIKSLLQNARGDLSASDFVDLSVRVRRVVNQMMEDSMDEVCSEVESLTDSFGGDTTLRQLKGE